MLNGDHTNIDKKESRSVFNSIEGKNLENDYLNKNLKHFLVSGLSGTGKTELIKKYYKNDLLIAFSHGEESKNNERKTLFQFLFEEINKPYKSIEIKSLLDTEKIGVFQILDYMSLPEIIKSTYFEKLPFFQNGYFLIDHFDIIQHTLEQFKNISFKSWLIKNLFNPKGSAESSIQEKIESIIHSLNKLKIVKVYTLPDFNPFYIISNYHFLTKKENEILFNNVPISKENVCLYPYNEILNSNLWKIKYKPLMNLEGIRNNLSQRVKSDSFSDWYELNKRSVNRDLFKKRFVTPYILFNMYLKENIKIDMSYRTLFVDDFQLFASEEIEVLTKLMRSANRTFITYDPVIKIFDYRNERHGLADSSNNIQKYINIFSPKIYNLTHNYRVEKEDWLINTANEALELIRPSTTWRFSNSISSKVQRFETPLIEELKETKDRFGLIFRTNEQISRFCDILIKNKLNFTKVTNNFFETYVGNMYVTFLFKYVLSQHPSEKFENFIRKNKTFNIQDWPKFQKFKIEFLNFNLNQSPSIFDVFMDNNQFKYISYFLLNETAEKTLEKAMKKYLDQPYLYVYYHSHYYNQVYQHTPLINVLNFHKLKQISSFDRIIFPLIKDDSKGYNYLAISKAKRGYGLFPFQVLEGGNYNKNNQEIMTDFEDKIKTITLFSGT